ncbi:diguanylate cyclase [Aestuariivita boseongensis]|uniref:diguanylate cyclase n=1 Tax=Aestuariivita boseongensis TaxID=1470562 RepID=UPI0006819A68|nr:diguanylate cyclase [Aestuariivita boseongensis]
MQGTVIIADAVSTNRILLKAKLAPWSYDVQMASTGAELLRLVELHPPSLIILSDDLPDAPATELCAKIKGDPALKAVPLIAFAQNDEAEDRIGLLRAGADDVFARPFRDVVLQARVRSLIRARTGVEELNLRDGTSRALGFAEAQTGFAPAARVAILAPDPTTASTWRRGLRSELRTAELTAHSFRQGLGEIAGDVVPDVFVIDLHGPLGAKGLRLLADIRANPETRHAGVLAVLEDGAPQDLAADALDLGAGDLMLHGFDAQELALRLRSQIAQKQTHDRLRLSVENGLRDAVRDPMTGLFNRRYAMPYLTRVIEENVKTGRGFAVMVADLDHFKQVNDTFGHAAGDAVLTEAATRLCSDLRAEDLIARMGGEEFLIVLPDSSNDEALLAAERLRQRVDATPFADPTTGRAIHVTVSIGVAICCVECLTRKRPEESANALLQLADEALYRAKHAGRNQVTMVNAA